MGRPDAKKRGAAETAYGRQSFQKKTTGFLKNIGGYKRKPIKGLDDNIETLDTSYYSTKSGPVLSSYIRTLFIRKAEKIVHTCIVKFR